MKNLINLTYKEKDGVIECNEFEYYLIIGMDSNDGMEYVVVESADYYRLDRIDVVEGFVTLEAAKEWLHNEVVEIVRRLFGVK